MKLHRTVSQRQEAQAEQRLAEALLALRSAEECRAFLRDLCTPAELQAMADRWAVVGDLQRGLSYREIHKHTGVSLTTIARVARTLAAGDGGYALATRRLGPVHIVGVAALEPPKPPGKARGEKFGHSK